jgi:hypothetical protein
MSFQGEWQLSLKSAYLLEYIALSCTLTVVLYFAPTAYLRGEPLNGGDYAPALPCVL